MAKIKAYIASAISYNTSSSTTVSPKRGPKMHLGQPGNEAVATIGQSIVSIAPDLSAINRKDIANSVEFCARASNAKGDPEAWLAGYFDTIWKPGGRDNHVIRHRDIDLSQVADGTAVVDLIKDVIQADTLLDFDDERKKAVGRALDSLAKEQSRRALFNSFIPKGKNISFAVTDATLKNPATDGTLLMRTIGFDCEVTAEEITDCLLFKINETDIKVSTSSIAYVSFPKILDAKRKRMQDKLRAAPGEYIYDIPLD
ncbi:hypothetical protein BD779DRAFT_1678941 [Infundibulicybe gibba]|nr:hypothetical protein BD779DRAFT_1678941 [Infundibulicybe gibba]